MERGMERETAGRRDGRAAWRELAGRTVPAATPAPEPRRAALICAGRRRPHRTAPPSPPPRPCTS